jgi:diaminopimelate epimerase
MVRFAKVEGLGNDFIVVDRRRSTGATAPLGPEDAVAMCDRRRGIGADGVLLLDRSSDADVRMTVLNADGSRPEMCGNGLRCVVGWLTEGRAGSDRTVRVATDAGLLRGWMEPDGRIGTELGDLVLTHPEVSVDDLELSGPATGWSAGNPHLVLPVRERTRGLAERWGPGLEHHPAFPRAVNVGFAWDRGDTVELTVFERGVGLTLACGTGAAAAACAVLRARGRTTGRLFLELPGGRVEAVVEPATGAFGRVTLIGPARRVFEGEWLEGVPQRL